MKGRMLRILFLLMLPSSMFGQISREVIDRVESYPSSYRLYEQLSEQVMSDFESDYDRAAAIYTWMAKNIRYDAKAFFSGRVQRSAKYTYRNEAEKRQKEQALRDELAETTLKKKKAVCQGYSELYRLLCQACGISCEVISGYSRTGINDIGKTHAGADHAWNAIRLNGEWLFVDATWGAGHVDYQKKQFVAAFTPAYFAAEPKAFSYNHFPEDAKWNFTSLTLKTFAEQPLVYHSFFGKGFELVAPQEGVIKKARKGRVNIELKGENGEGHTFYYAFRDMKYMQKANVHKRNDSLVLSIDLENRRSGYLDIIIDEHTVMTYRLKIR